MGSSSISPIVKVEILLFCSVFSRQGFMRVVEYFMNVGANFAPMVIFIKLVLS